MHRLGGLLLILPLLLAAIHSAQATTLTGKVLDPSGAVLPGVGLRLIQPTPGAVRSTVSDSQGVFAFEGLGRGIYILQADAEGFTSKAVKVELSRGDLSLDLEMEIGVLSDEIVVTGGGTSSLSREAARNSYVVSAEELENRHESFLAEALLPIPGLRVQRAAGPGSFTSIRFRGLRDADTSLLINGFQIHDPGGFRGDISAFWEDLMVGNIERIEVLPGASSNLYGSSASGGVINLIPSVGAGPPSLTAAFEGGGLGLFQETLQSQGALGGRFQYSFGAQRTDVNEGLDGDDVYRSTSLNSLMRFDVAPRMSLTGILTLVDSPRSDLNESPFPIGPAGNELGFLSGTGPVTGFVPDLNDPDSRRDARLFAAIVNWEHQVNRVWSYSAHFQNTDTERDFSDGPAASPFLSDLGAFEFAFDSFLVEASSRIVGTRHYLRGGPHLFTIGMEHEQESFSSAFTLLSPTLPGPVDRQSSTAFYFQDQISLLDSRVLVTANFRTQIFQVDNPESVPELTGLDTPDAYTGGLALAFRLNDEGSRIRVQAANGFRAPSLSERFSIFNSEIGLIRVGNPLLRPERSLSLDAGFDHYFWNDRARFGATYFYNRLQEIIVSTALFQQTNARGGLSRGVELSGRTILSPRLEASLSYTYTKADFVPGFDVLRSDNTIADGNLSRRIEGIPEHQWAAGLHWTRGRWNVNAEYAGIGDYDEPLFAPVFPFSQVLFDLDGHNRLDLGLSYTLPTGDRSKLEFYVRVENALDDAYFEDGFRAPGAVAWGGLRFKLK